MILSPGERVRCRCRRHTHIHRDTAARTHTHTPEARGAGEEAEGSQSTHAAEDSEDAEGGELVGGGAQDQDADHELDARYQVDEDVDLVEGVGGVERRPVPQALGQHLTPEIDGERQLDPLANEALESAPARPVDGQHCTVDGDAQHGDVVEEARAADAPRTLAQRVVPRDEDAYFIGHGVLVLGKVAKAKLHALHFEVALFVVDARRHGLRLLEQLEAVEEALVHSVVLLALEAFGALHTHTHKHTHTHTPPPSPPHTRTCDQTRACLQAVARCSEAGSNQRLRVASKTCMPALWRQDVPAPGRRAAQPWLCSLHA